MVGINEEDLSFIRFPDAASRECTVITGTTNFVVIGVSFMPY